MSCSQFELWIVSDDQLDQLSAEKHASGCRRCASILAGQRRLGNMVRDWQDSEEAPSTLEDRVVDMLRQPAWNAAVRPFKAAESSRKGLWVWALAACLILGIGLGRLQYQLTPRAPENANRLLVEEAMAAADSAEKEHAKAIARMEVAAGPVLAKAENFDLRAHEAARLMEYRDRLAYLDATIEEIKGYVGGNPGQARARAVLLAAYKEKTQVLREVLALEERS